MIASYGPIWLVDVGGSVLMIVFSVFSLITAHRLKERDPNNIVWAYLFWVCASLTIFAVSRSAGHIARQLLLLSGHAQAWESISPFSGAVNTLALIVVGSVTLFFDRTWLIYQQIQQDKQRLQITHKKMVYLNQNLEQLVEKRTELLAESEYKYRRIFEVSQDIIIVTREDGQMVDINASGVNFLGLSADNKKQLPRLQEYLFTAKIWTDIVDALYAEGLIPAIELDMKDGCGDARRVLLSASVLGAPGTTDNSIHFLIKDIEQQRRMREQMAQADKLASIGEFSSGIAHEINNPLGIILGYTQLMIRSEKKDSGRIADLKTIEKHVQSCKFIVEDLLNFARQSKTEKQIVNINTVIEDALTFIRQHSGKKKIDIVADLSNDLRELLVDEKKMKQVFINLITNAIHAINDNGRISIHTRMCKGKRKVKIDIQDTGHGIEENDIPRIFDPFFTTKPTGEGTGLGLSVSYGIVRNHGGSIEVKSTVDHGTVFTIELPVDVQVQAGTTDKEEAVDQIDSRS